MGRKRRDEAPITRSQCNLGRLALRIDHFERRGPGDKQDPLVVGLALKTGVRKGAADDPLDTDISNRTNILETFARRRRLGVDQQVAGLRHGWNSFESDRRARRAMTTPSQVMRASSRMCSCNHLAAGIIALAGHVIPRGSGTDKVTPGA
jgi:hypothetical protein